jgi:hypothetical protein
MSGVLNASGFVFTIAATPRVADVLVHTLMRTKKPLTFASGFF